MRKLLTALVATSMLFGGTVAQAETRAHIAGFSKADSASNQDRERRKRRGLLAWLLGNGIPIATALAIIAVIAASSGGDSNGNSPN